MHRLIHKWFDTLMTAVLDRLVHHAHIVPITGESYRTKDRRSPQQTVPGKVTRAGKKTA